MTAPAPAPFGLLLDVDGPIASPIERRIAIGSILDDLLTLAAAGIPIAFITGRSDAFMREQVVARLVAGGLDARAHVFGVFEKGGCWAPVTSQGLGELEIDEALAIPAAVRDAVEGLARERYADTMFVDEEKHVMISLEASTEMTPAEYQAAQSRYQEEVFALMERARARGALRRSRASRCRRRRAVAHRPDDHLDRRRVGASRQRPRCRSSPRLVRLARRDRRALVVGRRLAL